MSRKHHRAADERFAALEGLKPHAQSKRRAPAVVEAMAADPAAEDLGLFRATLAGITPLAADNHADIQRPRPSARPRPRPVEIEPPPPPRPPQGADVLVWAAYRDVTPIKDTGRVDMSSAAQRKPLAEAISHLEDELPEVVGNDPAALFRLAMKGAAPLAQTNRLHLTPEPPAATPRQKELNDQEVLRESLTAPITFEDRLDMGDEAAFLRPGLPRRVLTDLRRGRWVVQRQLDLHGLTRDEARAALAAFLGACLKDGQRCLRLIHGKGLGSPGGEPVLKHLSKSWLAQRDEILAFCQARPFDGGAGALLILLRAGQAG